MDGYTDAAFRFVVAKYGKPDVIFTEFVPAKAIEIGVNRIMVDLLYDPIERPIIAQLFGNEPEAIYKASLEVIRLGFNGIDLNMGCPAKNINHAGAGAALINDQGRARAIIKAARQALVDNPNYPGVLSVKTRIGYLGNEVSDWLAFLAQQPLDAITVHGRSYKQMYKGEADWLAIQEAARVCRSINPNLKILGNGDVHSIADANDKMRLFNVDGVLIGRASLGNPWVFSGIEPPFTERIKVALDHVRHIYDIFPKNQTLRFRKHLNLYLRGFEGAKAIRERLMLVTELVEIEAILKEIC